MNHLICPECGSSVSIDATVCRNCGYKITVCPACGEVHQRGVARCAKCGKVLSEEALYAKAAEDSKKVEAQIGVIKKRKKIFTIISWGIKICSFICYAIAVIVYFLWQRQEYESESLLNMLDGLIHMDSRINTCLVLFIIGSICNVLDDVLLEVIMNVIKLNSIVDWIRDTKFNYREYIRLHSSEESAQLDSDSYMFSTDLSEAALLIENEKAKGLAYFIYIINSIICVCMEIPFALLAYNLIPQLFMLKFIPIEIEWRIPEFYAFLAFLVAMFACKLVILLVYPKFINKKKNEILGQS